MVVQVPNSIDPEESGNTYDSETFFDLRKMVMKMRTNPGARQPLLTNPSSCVTGSFAASFTGYISTTGTSDVPYPIVGCEALAFAPTLSASIKRPDGSAPNASDFQGVDLVAALYAQPGEAGISLSRAASDRRSSRPCFASRPKSTVAAIAYAFMPAISSGAGARSVACSTSSA